VLGVFSVHFSKIVHVTHEDSGLDDLGHVSTSLLEDSFDVVEDKVGLGSDGVLVVEFTSGGIKRDLTRGKEHAVDLDGLTVRTNSLGSLVSGNYNLALMAARALVSALAFATLTATGALLALLTTAATVVRAFAFALAATGALLGAFLTTAATVVRAFAFALATTGATFLLALFATASTVARALTLTLAATGALLALLTTAATVVRAFTFTLAATGATFLLALLATASTFLGAFTLTLAATRTLLFGLTLLRRNLTLA